MTTASMFLIGLIQAILILLAAPFFSGYSRVLRAKMHSRHGPPIFQNYHDIRKLMKRQEVVSKQADWIFRVTPYIVMAAMLLVAMIVPILTTFSPLGLVGDLIFVVYLFTLARFFIALSGLETGSTFGGIGARREQLLSVLIEPIILLVLFVMALLAGSTNLGIISHKIATGQTPYYTSVWLGMLAFAFGAYAEMGKLPLDVGEAEQELQEGFLSEYSGRSLALIKWGLYIKQVVLAALFLAVFLPFGSMTSWSIPSILMAAAVFFLKILFFYTLIGFLENSMARLRFMKVSTVTWAALGAAVLSFVFYLANV